MTTMSRTVHPWHVRRVERLAYHHAQRWTDIGADSRELAAVGLLALAEARTRFEPNRGVTLWAFAARRIDGAMRDHRRGITGTRAGRNSERLIKDERDTERIVDPRRADEVFELAHDLGVASLATGKAWRDLVTSYEYGGISKLAERRGVSIATASRWRTDVVAGLRETVGADA